jgi:hypothetical protein
LAQGTIVIIKKRGTTQIANPKEDENKIPTKGKNSKKAFSNTKKKFPGPKKAFYNSQKEVSKPKEQEKVC